MIVCSASIFSGLGVYLSVQSLTNKVDSQERRIVIIESKMQQVVIHSDLEATMKRVELQLELMMAKAGLDGKVKVR